MDHFERAKDKIMMGAERRSMVMSEDEKKLTAYHEAGHAIVGLSVPEHDPVHKVTIIPRGRALGVTMFLPEADRYSHSQDLAAKAVLPAVRRPRRRGTDLRRRQGHDRRVERHPARDRSWRATWSPSTACPTSSAR